MHRERKWIERQTSDFGDRWRVSLVVAWVPIFLNCSAVLVVASTSVWTGGGTDSNWSTPQNWNPTLAPANNGTADIALAGSTQLSPVVDTSWDINSLTFNANAGAFTVRGGPLTLGAGGITDESTVNQTLDTPVVLDANQNWNIGSGANANFLLYGTLNTNGYALTITGSAEGGLLDQAISGSGSLVINASSPFGVASYGLNTYSGGTYLNQGELFISSDQSLGAAGNPIIFNGGALGVGSQSTINQDITLNSGGGQIYSPLAQYQTLAMTSNIHGPGSLKITGGGASYVQLSGNNVYSGGTSVSNCTLLGTTGSIQGNISLANIYAQVEFEQNTNGVYSGNISGGGEVSIDGSGIVAFTGNNTYTSDTQLYSGVLEVSASGGGLSPSSRLIFEQNVGSSAGILQVVGGGSFTRPFSQVIFNGPGGFAARDGKLTVNIGGGSGQFTLSPHSNLVFGSPTANSVTEFQNPIFLGSAESSPAPVVEVDAGAGGDYAILSGVISGANYFAKTGNGQLVLTAANTYTGPTIIAGGSLTVTGSLAKTPVSVQGGASIGGAGSIVGSITLTGGSASSTHRARSIWWTAYPAA